MAMKWYLHACPVCSGDLHDDLEDKGWVTCFMCARSFNAKDVLAVQRAEHDTPEPSKVSKAA
jgi:hypothetical protein